MKFKIIVDSSANLLNNYLEGKDVLFESVPLITRIGNSEYVDDENCNLDEMMKKLEKTSEKCTSSCPSPQAFLDSFTGADYYFVITITKKLSGSFNSALVAKNSFKDPNKVFVLDSKAVAGTMILLVDKLVELIESGLDYNEICAKISEYRDSLELLFVLNKFDNLVRNGRMNKVVAFIATSLKIKPLCFAQDGEIKVKEKIRTLEGVFKRLVVNIGKMKDNFKDKVCIITHTNNLEGANFIKNLIEEHYNFKEIRIVANRGLCSFYALDKGIMVAF